MKDDEKRFLVDIYTRCANYVIHNPLTQQGRLTPRDIINESDFYMPHKRAWYLLEKWSGKGWYSWGVVMDLGWLETKGEYAAKEFINKEALS